MKVMLQVTRLKRAAESRFDSILKSIRQNGTSPSPASSASAGPADLQGRLEAAIGVLQDGLIERDTEVSSLQHPQQYSGSSFLATKSTLPASYLVLVLECNSLGSTCSPDSHCRPDRNACTQMKP